MNKRGATILTESVIFILLNLLFFSILILFLYNKATGAALLEESYAKQIALLIDSAKPNMVIFLNMENAFIEAEKEKIDFKEIVYISEGSNRIVVKLGDGNRKGYVYSFFNNVNIKNYYPDTTKEGERGYIFLIGDYNE